MNHNASASRIIQLARLIDLDKRSKPLTDKSIGGARAAMGTCALATQQLCDLM
jgi:hypothetical protein